MKPYYHEAGIRIYHGDCLNVLHKLDFLSDPYGTFPGGHPEHDHAEPEYCVLTEPLAACVMDPPFASGARTEAGKKTSGSMLSKQSRFKHAMMNDQMTTTGFVWLIREVCQRVRPLLMIGGSVISFIDWRQWPNLVGAVESTNLRVNQMMVWDKMFPGMGHGFRSQHELMMHASRGTARVNDRGAGNVFQYPREAPIDHPSPKPIPLMRRLIKVVSARGETILDPFMGSGRTLRAAKDLGRHAIGIEVEEKYCEVAAKLLRQETLPFEEQKAEQAPLFDEQ